MNKILIMFLVLTIFAYGCSSDNAGDGGPNLGETISSISVMKEITDSIGKSLKGEYMVSYDMDFGEDTAEVTIYMKDEKLRSDTLSQGIESRSYFVDDVATMCTKQDGKFTCIKATSQEDIINPADTEFEFTEYEEELSSEEENTQFKIYRDGTMTVSGHTAKCYAFEYGDTTTERMCLSNEGVLLYHKSTDGGETSEFTAKSYSNKVSDDVFELPEGAEIVDLNDQMAQIQAEYGDEMESINRLGECYSDCDSQDLSDEDLEECYMDCQ